MNTYSHHVQHGPGRVSVGVFPAMQLLIVQERKVWLRLRAHRASSIRWFASPYQLPPALVPGVLSTENKHGRPQD